MENVILVEVRSEMKTMGKLNLAREVIHTEFLAKMDLRRFGRWVFIHPVTEGVAQSRCFWQYFKPPEVPIPRVKDVLVRQLTLSDASDAVLDMAKLIVGMGSHQINIMDTAPTKASAQIGRRLTELFERLRQGKTPRPEWVLEHNQWPKGLLN
jgi:hypothetical protein